MKVIRLVVGMLGVNCYMIIDEETNDAAIIDAGGNGAYLIEYMEKENINPKYILLTHCHYDHTGAVMELCNHYNLPFYMSEGEYNYVSAGAGDLFRIDGFNSEKVKFITEDSVFHIGKSEIKVIKTPGHSPGGVTFQMDDYLFTGDTLFQGSIGRTDFEGGDMAVLLNSIKHKLINFPDNTMVLPGHGPESDIITERKSNPFLKDTFRS